MRLGWMSDIHLNFLDENRLRSFLSGLSSYNVDGWLISGDIGESSNVIYFLDLLIDTLDQPIYFVLGNHDFYGSSLSKTTCTVKKFVENKPQLIWLTWAEIQNLGSGIALVGDDGWGDARLGHAYETSTMLNDFFQIQELRGLNRQHLVEKLNQLGDKSVFRLRPKLFAAAENNNKVIVVTHVPPFGEAARNERQPSKDDYLPWYSCKVMGDLLLDCADTFPNVNFLVVCGHTHGASIYHPRPNLEVLTAGAEYFVPKVDRILEL